jgi:SAM-dependent methyltransferase
MLQEFLDLLEAGMTSPRVTEIIERDDGYIYTQQPARYFAPPQEWREFERAALNGARGRVLDIGCGAGRFALALQRAGTPVTALDISPGAVQVSGRRGVREAGLGTVADVAAGGQRFDTFLLMGENLGLLESASRAPGFLGELAAVAQPGAQIIAHGADPYAAGDPVLDRYLRRERPDGHLPGEMTIRIRHRDLATNWFGYLLCAPAELADLTTGTGWTLASTQYADRVNYLAVLSYSG